MHKNTRIVYRENDKRRNSPIDHIYKTGKTIELWTDSGWTKAKVIQLPATKMYRLVYSDNRQSQYIFSEDHLQPILGKGLIPVKDLIIGDELQFCKKQFRSRGEYEYRQLKDRIEVNYLLDHMYEIVLEKDEKYMLLFGLMAGGYKWKEDT